MAAQTTKIQAIEGTRPAAAHREALLDVDSHERETVSRITACGEAT